MNWARRSCRVRAGRWCVAWVFLAALCAGAAPARAARVALVIGNGAYDAPLLSPLLGCPASARAVGAALRNLGYEVVERVDAGRGAMDAAITSFTGRLRAEEGSVAVAYVCGHVVTSGGRPFLLPAGATLARETDVLTQGVLARGLVDAATRTGARGALLALDAGSASAPDLRALAELGAGRVVLASATPPAAEGVTPLAALLQRALAGPSVPLDGLVAALRGGGGQVAGTAPAGVDLGTAPTAAAPPTAAPTPVVPPPRASAPPVAMPAAPAAAMPEEARMTPADRRRVQAALASLGYYAGTADGVFGAETRAAIRRFQFEIGEDRTGMLTAAQATRLARTPPR
ncbi:peptidoglycan-binding protein [Roseomonas sp. CCTCC AB2023176]|uniref:peptidoglycan-binding protein n=1 Tax=Roseomonas sp. CCTCC AB2023176 TaxID=3342640 RepID=UPI0035DD307D